jgi:hypothetical protein
MHALFTKAIGNNWWPAKKGRIAKMGRAAFPARIVELSGVAESYTNSCVFLTFQNVLILPWARSRSTRLRNGILCYHHHGPTVMRDTKMKNQIFNNGKVGKLSPQFVATSSASSA